MPEQSGSTLTVIDPEALGTQITALETLYNTWADTVETPPDAGECGGSTIIHMEAMGKMFQEMQDAFVLLLGNTLSYMKNRKESVETKEADAASAAGGSK